MQEDRRNFDTKILDLISLYFNHSERKVSLKEGEVLFREGEYNSRLYYLQEGVLSGCRSDHSEEVEEVISLHAGEFLGVRSFFDDELCNFITLTSEGESTLYYVTLDDIHGSASPERVLMPVVVHSLMKRQEDLHEMLRDQRESEQKVQELERVSSLGQFSAGVAHELNNAISVISRGSEWLSGAVEKEMKHYCTDTSFEIFLLGLKKGRLLSSLKAREQSKLFRSKFNLSFNEARKLGQMGLDENILKNFKTDLKSHVDQIFQKWEIGTTFRDLMLSSEHASSVVESMRNLGAKGSMRLTHIDLQESIHSAMTILQNVTKGIELQLNLPDEYIGIRTNKGELAQVWINLVRNACDALRSYKKEKSEHQPRVTLSAQTENTTVKITIADNASGIPVNLLNKIFQPSFTTKKNGLSFGLGIGLSIVSKIVASCGGSISAGNTPEGAKFTIYLPFTNTEDRSHD